MTTKAESKPPQGSSHGVWHMRNIAGSMAPIELSHTNVVRGSGLTNRVVAHGEQISSKAMEAKRQIERLQRITSLAINNEDDQIRAKAGKSVASSITMISGMINGPIPIPVAGRGEDGGASLFFDEAGFYGDIEIHGDEVEYFLKTPSDGRSHEIYDSELSREGRVPPKLLGWLYRNFARSK